MKGIEWNGRKWRGMHGMEGKECIHVMSCEFCNAMSLSQCNVMQCNVTQCNVMLWYGAVWYGMVCYGTVCSGSVCNVT